MKLGMFRLLVVMFVLLSGAVFGQQSDGVVFLDATFQEVSKKKHAVYTQHMRHLRDSLYEGTIYNQEQKLKMRGDYVLMAEGYVAHGLFEYYFENGRVESEGEYRNGLKIGSWKRFMADGTPKAERYYPPKGNKLIQDAISGKL